MNATLHLYDKNSTSYFYYITPRHAFTQYLEIRISRQVLFTLKLRKTHFTLEKRDHVTTNSTINVWNIKLITNWIYLHEKIQKEVLSSSFFLDCQIQIDTALNGGFDVQ